MSEGKRCLLLEVVPLQILSSMVSEYFCVPSVSSFDVAVTSATGRAIWKLILQGNKIDALTQYSPSYIRFGLLKWLSRRGIVLSENFKVHLPSHPSVLTRDWETTYANIGPSALTMVASSGSLEVMNLLLAKENLNKSKTIDDTDGCGFSPLMIATSKNDPRMVKTLLEHGANPRLQCFSNDRSALHLACINGNAECVSLLLQCPTGDITLRDRMGRNALFYAAKNLPILQLLVSSPSIRSALNQKDYANGETPLNYYSRKNFSRAAQLLLTVPGVDIHCPNRDGKNFYLETLNKGDDAP